MSDEERIDSNPYAYPYFHSDGSGPLLYRLILEVEEKFSPASSINDQNAAAQRRDHDEDVDTAKQSADLLRRIRSRCIVRPVEATWADSCGDNALHRLSQAARFGQFRPGPASSTSHGTASAQQQQPSPPCEWDDMVITLIKSIVNSAPSVASAQNSWRETALHQFASHCGIGSSILGHSGDDSDGGGITVRDLSHPETADEVVQLLIHASPESARVCNYLVAPPLHEACSLSHGPDELMRRFVPDLTVNRSARHIVARNEGLEWMRKRQRVIVRRLVSACPEALFASDKMGRTPLLRAVESDRTGGDVVALLFDECERYCRTVLNLDNAETCNVIKSLATGEVAETCAVSELARFAEFSFGQGQGGGSRHDDRISENEVRRAVRCLARGDLNSNIRNRRSPIDFLMNEWQWTPRKLGLAGSTTGIMAGAGGAALSAAAIRATVVSPSRTTVSALVTAALRRGTNPHDITTQLGPLWEKTVLLLKAAYYGSINERPARGAEDGGWRLVHAAVAFCCPTPLIHLLVRLSPRQVIERDERGRTPLIMACSSSFLNQMRANNRDVDACKCVDLVKLIIQTNDSSCRIVDSNCRLPLHVAIQAGHQWHTILQTIFAAEPRALLARDPSTGLYPFMLAAIANNEGAGKQKRKLTVTYELLRADPSCIELLQGI
mmetsp:Transcript_26141/g.56625  ORF Transcript_26141/g.56625 Transcript_26141/m.56625 type:complete len:668 (+) Transcript_26141:226-2229(+)